MNVDDVEDDEWKVHGFLSSAHRQAEVEIRLCEINRAVTEFYTKEIPDVQWEIHLKSVFTFNST